MLHRPVAAAGWNDDAAFYADAEGEVERAFCPQQPFGLIEKRRLKQDECANLDIMLSKLVRRALEIVEGHPLIEARQNLGMRRFQAHRDLQSRSQAILEFEAASPNHPRMTFDYQCLQ